MGVYTVGFDVFADFDEAFGDGAGGGLVEAVGCVNEVGD